MATTHKQPRLHLLSIGVSHYCEKARWGLERAGATFSESKHFPAFHRLFVRKLGGPTSLPKLIISDGEKQSVLHDSSDILTFCDTLMHAQGESLHPPDLQETVQLWEKEFDEQLGPHVRRWVYCHVLYKKGLFGSMCQGAPILERVAGFAMFPLIQLLIYKGVGCDKENAKERSLEKITDIFNKVDETLADGRPFICGDKFTAADLTMAALAAPVVFPDGCGSSLPTLDQCPAEMIQTVQRLRDTAAGRHILRMYESQRHKSGSTYGGVR